MGSKSWFSHAAVLLAGGLPGPRMRDLEQVLAFVYEIRVIFLGFVSYLVPSEFRLLELFLAAGASGGFLDRAPRGSGTALLNHGTPAVSSWSSAVSITWLLRVCLSVSMAKMVCCISNSFVDFYRIHSYGVVYHIANAIGGFNKRFAERSVNLIAKILNVYVNGIVPAFGSCLPRMVQYH